MQDWTQLEQDLIKYSEVSGAIRIQLFSYINKINELIDKISDCSFEDSSDQFNSLYMIQNQIATALYKYNFELPEVLEDFVRSFDRDDEFAREHWYRKFKDGFRLMS